MDIIDDLAYPLPVIVIAEMLGIPHEDRARFKAWSDAIVGASFAGARQPAQAEMSAYFLDMIEQRRQARARRPDQRAAERANRRRASTQRELLGFCVLLLVAGNETTTNLIGNAILCFTSTRT